MRSQPGVTPTTPPLSSLPVLETPEQTQLRTYGSVLSYQCGLARKFFDPELEEFYQERRMTCNWNMTWTTRDYLDSCGKQIIFLSKTEYFLSVWTQCLYPPQPPPESLLISTWDGEPVEFFENVSYVCEEEEFYFEWDRNIPEFNVTCQPDGSWPPPEQWPVCLSCKY